MLTYQKVFDKPKKLIRLTGLTSGQSTTLAKRLLPLGEEAERKRLSRPDQKRAVGAGRRYKLATIVEKLTYYLRR